MSTLCPFCDRKFSTHQGLSSHYKIHKDLPLSDWLEHGPARSKKKLAHFKAEKEAGRLIRDDTEPILSPEPLRAVRWVERDCYVELPWLTQNPEGGSNRKRPPGPPSPFRATDWVQVLKKVYEREGRTKSNFELGADSKKRYPLFDLNLPPTC